MMLGFEYRVYDADRFDRYRVWGDVWDAHDRAKSRIFREPP